MKGPEDEESFNRYVSAEVIKNRSNFLSRSPFPVWF